MKNRFFYVLMILMLLTSASMAQSYYSRGERAYRGGYRSGHLGLYREDYLAINMEGRYGLNAQFATYRPTEHSLNSRDTLVSGSLMYWNTPYTKLSVNYGTWKHTWGGTTAGTGTINPLSLNIYFHNNSENNIKFFYGGGIGWYRFDWNRTTKVDNGDYNKTGLGFQLLTGLEYYMTESFTANVELKYHGCNLSNAVPSTVNSVVQTDRNLDISDFTVGAGLSVYF